MKQTIILLSGIILFYIIFSNFAVASNLIPEDAIRIRVIPNSNDKYDQEMKNEVSDMLKEDMYNLLKDVKGTENAKIIINDNIPNIEKNINNLFDKNNYEKGFNIKFGLNYFPEKEYKGIKYNEGYYDSLVVTIGEGKGDNWWCVLFPPLCLIEAEESDDVEYTTIVSEIIKKYL